MCHFFASQQNSGFLTGFFCLDWAFQVWRPWIRTQVRRQDWREKSQKKRKKKTEAREHPTDLGRIRQRMKINFHPTIPLSFRHVCRVSTRKGDGSKATRIQKPSLQCPRVPATGHVYGITLCAVRVHRQQAMSTCNRPCVPSKGHRPKLVLQKQ